MRRRLDGAIALSLLAAVAAVPIGAFLGVVLRGQPPALPSQRRAPAVLLPAPHATLDGRRAVEVVLAWEPGPALLSSGGGGTITRLDVGPGSTVGTGTSVAMVDGHRVVALAGATPLYRDLVAGDRGPDVQAVRHLLVALGELTDQEAPGDRVDGGLLRAANAAGLTELDPAAAGVDAPVAPATLRIARSRIVWVGTEPATLGSLDVALGGPWPDAGAPFARGAARINSATIELGDRALPAGSDALVLVVGDATLPLDAEGTVSDPALPWLAASVDPEVERVDGEIRFAAVIDTTSVPASAVVTDGSTSCILARRSGGWAPVPIELLDAELGRTLVRSSDRLPDEVLANPHQVVARPRCSS